MDIFSLPSYFLVLMLSIFFIFLLISLFVYLRHRQDFKLKASSAESEKKFESIFESTTDAIIVADQTGIIMQWNSGAESIFGYSKEEALGSNLEIIIPGSFVEAHRKGLQRYLDTAVPHVIGQRIELVGERKDGSAFPIEMSLSTWKSDKVVFFGSIIRDITKRREAEEKIHSLVYKDSLTGLPNRRLFNDHLVSLLNDVDNKQPFALLYIDLDHFKMVNDTYGHSVGDQLLMEVAVRFQSIAYEHDTISRLSGDEFIMLLQNTDKTQAANHAHMMLELFKKPFHFQPEELFVTPSIGISMYPTDGTDLDTLVKNADIALYQAKARGKNNFQFFTKEINQSILRKSKLAIDLRKGLEHDEFFIHYQPQIDLKTEQLVGLEALVRWNHPEWGAISPAEFIPIAEDTGSIVQLGEYVLRQACLQNKAWQRAGLPKFRVAVNISSHQFSQSNLTETVHAALIDSGLEPRYLELELTESIIQSSSTAIATMNELKTMGVYLSIDDFGTGYSSLRYLKLFPIDTLKIDQYFIRNIITDLKDAALVATIIRMANDLQLNVIAEGVETAEQFQFLKQKDCNQAQGYYFNRPLPPTEIERLYGPAHNTQSPSHS
ncbi:putative bifunctional diguanylate cyclase/phosphodiesterase [Planococcus faecalis]|uniref:Diguanylate cyclase n=1 Tax=Planococcus faecalis TaxID=1598147 RepID=A0ABM6INE6_9BACL|nr:EAL domain-containing protein [Planococcus faecalis]AQU77959.1 diguanylate cyclase [Planococcus faecalis]OHX52167.1 diguanylate cyclase [Planococcus faecalis]